MGGLTKDETPSATGFEARLDSWKEIAAYFSRDVTTVQRWEKREGMPVHRHLHDRMGSVYAYRAELDAWARGRNLRPTMQQEPVSLPIESAIPDPPAAPPSLNTRNFRGGRWFLLLGAVVTLVIVAALCFQRTEYFWRNPIADFRFHTLTNFDGVKGAAAISRDGHFIAFLSDREGAVDVWVTQVGSGEFHNLTHGTLPGLLNPAIRSVGFSPDGSIVTCWVRKQGDAGDSDISVWGVPTLGGPAKPYLPGVAEMDWSPDGTRLAYHTPGPGDPLFVSTVGGPAEDRPIFTAAAGLHSHFPLWSPDGAYLYFVQGELPDKLDIWRIPSSGGTPERMTSHHAAVSYPVFLDRRTLLYLAGDADGSGPWLHSMDVERRVAHRLTARLDRFTSLAVAADGQRLAATLASAKTSLWRLHIDGASPAPFSAVPIPLTTGNVSQPRLMRDSLLYVAATGTGESLWRSVNGVSSEIWSAEEVQIFGAPAISPDQRWIAFSASRHGQKLLYLMQADGATARVVTTSLNLEGAPAWAPDGRSITTAVEDHGIPRLYQVPLDGRPATPLASEYSINPAWSPDGRFVVYTGADIGTTFSVRAVTAGSVAHPMPAVQLSRGARHLVFLPGSDSLVVLRGEMQHKDLWLVDLKTGAERQLTHLPPEFDTVDFDISSDGHDFVLERTLETSDLVMLDLPPPSSISIKP